MVKLIEKNNILVLQGRIKADVPASGKHKLQSYTQLTEFVSILISVYLLTRKNNPLIILIRNDFIFSIIQFPNFTRNIF